MDQRKEDFQRGKNVGRQQVLSVCATTFIIMGLGSIVLKWMDVFNEVQSNAICGALLVFNIIVPLYVQHRSN